MSESPWIVEVDEGSFDAQVVQRSRELPIVIDFWAEWCPPCRMLAPLLESAANEYAGKFILAKINIDDCPNLAGAFQVQSIPFVVCVYDREIGPSFSGMIQKEQLRTYLDSIMPSDSERLAREAAELELTDAASAIEKYLTALEKDRKNSRAKAALADLLVSAGEMSEARTLAEQVSEGTDGWKRASNVLAKLWFLEQADALSSLEECETRARQAPTDNDAQRNLGIVQAAKGQWEAALETFLGCIERDSAFGNKHVKDLVLKIFAIIGPQSELANKYRSRLASALY